MAFRTHKRYGARECSQNLFGVERLEAIPLRCCEAFLTALPRALQMRLLVAARIGVWQQEKFNQDLYSEDETSPAPPAPGQSGIHDGANALEAGSNWCV